MGGLDPEGYERLRDAMRRLDWLEGLTDADLVRYFTLADSQTEADEAAHEMARRLAPEIFDGA